MLWLASSICTCSIYSLEAGGSAFSSLDHPPSSMVKRTSDCRGQYLMPIQTPLNQSYCIPVWSRACKLLVDRGTQRSSSKAHPRQASRKRTSLKGMTEGSLSVDKVDQPPTMKRGPTTHLLPWRAQPAAAVGLESLSCPPLWLLPMGVHKPPSEEQMAASPQHNYGFSG